MSVIQSLVHGEVAEIEIRIAHRGVFPVDDAQALAVVDEIGREQIVMAGQRPPGTAQRAFDALHGGEGRPHRSGEAHPAGRSEAVVAADRVEGRKGSRKGPDALVAADGLGGPAQDGGPGSFGRVQHPSLGKTRDHEGSMGLAINDFRPDAAPRRGQARRVFASAVHAEQPGVFAAEAKDEYALLRLDPVVLIGDPAGEAGESGLQAAQARQP